MCNSEPLGPLHTSLRFSATRTILSRTRPRGPGTLSGQNHGRDGCGILQGRSRYLAHACLLSRRTDCGSGPILGVFVQINDVRWAKAT